MYVRKVIKKTSNSERIIYRLVESYRTPSGPRQRTILQLKGFDLPESKWKLLADAIESKLKGQTYIVFDDKIESLASHYASLIEQKQLAESNNVQMVYEEEDALFETVNLSSIKNKTVRTIGAEHIGLSVYRELGLDDLFCKLGFTEYQCQMAALSIIGRLVHPDSERATREWAINQSGLGELLKCDWSHLSNNALYRISDRIYQNKEKVEEFLQNKERSLFQLQEKLVLYDLTNTYLEGTASGNAKARFGHSKEKRTDCRLITLGLIIDECGFPKRSLVMEGNQSEPGSLLKMIYLLENTSEISKSKKNKTVVIDAGIATRENLAMLKEYGYDYLCVSRTKPLSEKEIETDKLQMVKTSKKNTVEVQLFEREEENVLYCRSFLRGEKERSMMEKLKNRFENELESLRSGLEKKRGTKKYDKVLERLGRIKERNSSIARYYIINIERDEDTNVVTSINWSLDDIDRMNFNYSGAYFLKTSRKDLNEQELWTLYSTLNMVEAAFRSLKSELAFRPVFHIKEYRADSHLFIAVLAYHLLNIIRIRLADKNIHFSWKKLRKIMSTHSLVTTTMKTKSGKKIIIRQASEAEHTHQEIYRALNLNICPIKRIVISK